MSKTSRLGDVAEFVRGITFKPEDVVPSNTDGSVRCMRTKNVQEVIDLSDVWSVDATFVKRSNQYLRAGDILVSSANSWNLVGKCSWVPELEPSATFGGFVSVLRADRSQVYPRYLYHWFASPMIQATVRSFGRQTTSISNLDLKRSLDLTVPLPAIPEQQRIATLLDCTEVLRAKRHATVALLDRLAGSIFVDMFGDTARNSVGWDDSRTLGDVSNIVSGITKGRKAEGPFERVPYLAVVNVQDMRLNLSTVKEIDATAAEIARYCLERNDLLLTEGGDPDKLGRGTLWREELPLSIHQNHIFRVRLHGDAGIDPVFLNWLVGSERGRRYFLRSAKQTTGIASINATQLREFPLLVPPLDLQRAFADRISKLEAQKAVHKTHLAALDTLFASLQYRAFPGEPQVSVRPLAVTVATREVTTSAHR
jgi:type I restriction enzyme S subunit